MRFVSSLRLTLFAFLLSLTPIASLSPIVISDEFLVYSETNTRFSCRGITVSPASVRFPYTNYFDHFIDSREHEWLPLIDSLVDLNVNCVRIYQVCNMNDPGAGRWWDLEKRKKDGAWWDIKRKYPACGSHGKFMKALEKAGIYAIIPVISGGPFYSNTLRADIAAPECYSAWRGKALFETAAARVEEFAKFNNTLAFNVGNELVLYGDESIRPIFTGVLAYPCVKALSRDLKIFMSSNKDMRPVPTLYAMQDSAGGASSIGPQSRYLTCTPDESDPMETVDIIGFNAYAWCSKNDTYETAYARFRKQLPSTVKAPVLLTEFGCVGADKNIGDSDYFVSITPWKQNFRTWDQVPSIFNANQLGSRFSGGFAYELVMYAGLRKAQLAGTRMSESYGLIATRVGGNIGRGNVNIVKLPTFYALADAYWTVAKEEEEKLNAVDSGGQQDVDKNSSIFLQSFDSPPALSSCGEKLSSDEMYSWLVNYRLFNKDTKKRTIYANEAAMDLLATGKMPKTGFHKAGIGNRHFHTSFPFKVAMFMMWLVMFFIFVWMLQGNYIYRRFGSYNKLMDETMRVKERILRRRTEMQSGDRVDYGSV